MTSISGSDFQTVAVRRLSRLEDLLVHATGDGFGREELADALNVSGRTVRRLIGHLQLLGVAVEEIGHADNSRTYRIRRRKTRLFRRVAE